MTEDVVMISSFKERLAILFQEPEESRMLGAAVVGTACAIIACTRIYKITYHR